MRNPGSHLCRALCAIVLALQVSAVAAATEQRWDLRDLYPTPKAWDSAFGELRARTEAMDLLKATLGPPFGSQS